VRPGPGPWTFVAAGGVVAGTLDIVYAIVYWAIRMGLPARRILQSVASGLLGEASFAGGAATAVLGLALHYGIAISMAVAYYLVSRRIPVLVRAPLALGSTYGVFLYALMNYVVVPLSAAGPGSKETLWVVLSILVHALFIGIPIALFSRRAHLAASRRAA
jgi:hypothetical protein